MIHYVYVYLDTRKPGEYVYDNLKFDYEPFYVGQGKNKRCVYGLKEGSTYKLRKINKIIKSGLEPKVIKIYDNLEHEMALSLEIDTIYKIGRYNLNKGPLVNLTDGGEGVKNHVVSIETRKKQSLARIGKSPYNKGISPSIETKEKISNSLKGDKNFNYGKHFSEEHKFKLSMSNKNPQIKPVYQYDLDDNFIKEYDSILFASKENNINKTNIGKCCRGLNNKAGNYKWKFKYLDGDHRKNKNIEI